MGKLSKTQISNWTRQRRWRRKKNSNGTGCEPSDTPYLGRKRKMKDIDIDDFPSKTPFSGKNNLLVDEVALNILSNAFEEGCLDEVDNYDTIALLAGCLVGD